MNLAAMVMSAVLIMAEGLGAIGMGIAIFAVAAAAIGMGIAVSKAVEACARQPEAAGKIRTLLLLGLAFIETTALYAFVIAFLSMVL